MLEAEGNFYLYGTQGSDANIQLRSSADLVDWEQLPDALPTLGTWAAVGKTWAPEVIAVNKGYVMFYTASDKASGKQCIGRAVAAGPRGPFTDSSTKPLVCQQELGGSIDASPQRDGDGTVYLYWKNDGNCCGLPVTLWGQEMDAAASKFVGRPTALLSNTQDWQGTLIEAPEMVPHDDAYYLFYAANDYSSESYAEGFAKCEAPLGPCVDNDEPLLASNASAAGPGHAFVITTGDKTWIVYHAWPPDAIGSARPGRQIWLDPLDWTPDGPVVDGPNPDPQARPGIPSGG